MFKSKAELWGWDEDYVKSQEKLYLGELKEEIC